MTFLVFMCLLLTFQLKEKKRSVWLKQRNTIQPEEEDWVKEGEMI